MKNAITLIAIAGMASVASAQNFSLDISGPSEVDEGAVFTMTVTGDSDFGTHMLGGGFSLTTGSALISDMSWTPASWSGFNEDGGYAGGGNYGGVVFGQLLLPIPGFDTPAAGSELGGEIGSFQVTLGAGSGSTIHPRISRCRQRSCKHAGYKWPTLTRQCSRECNSSSISYGSSWPRWFGSRSSSPLIQA